MSSEREVIHRWTCDVCEHMEAVGDDGSGYPKGWKQIAHTAITAKLGNAPAQHLCGNCSTSLHLLLANRLGDEGDMAQAWDEGFDACFNVSDDAHKQAVPNPYWTTETESTK